MWYRFCKKEEEIGYEYKIIRVCVIHLIKQKCFQNANYYLPDTKLESLTKKALKKIKSKYENFNFVRKHSDDGTLTKVIEPIVDEILKHAR